MLKELFRWLDAHPGFFWATAAAATALYLGWLAFSLVPRGGKVGPRTHAIVTGLVLLATLLAWRWPPLFGVRELNPDESQLVAGALTLKMDPVFWRSVDGTTSGPLNFFALLPTHLLGIPADYFNARLTGLLLVWGALWCTYGLFRRHYNAGVAVLGVVPGLAFFCTVTDSDFIHYTSEHPSLLLMMASALLFWRAVDPGDASGPPRPASWWAAGLFMGMLPWAKLQSAPIAAALALCGTVLAMRRSGRPAAARIRDVATLAAASLAPTAFFLIVTAAFGQWEHFYRGYIENNIIYVSTEFTIPMTIAKLYQTSMFHYSYPAFLAGPAFAGIVGVLAWIAWPGRPLGLAWSGLLMTAAGVIAVLAPRQGFHHYLLYTILPLTWWSAALVGNLHGSLRDPLRQAMLALAFVLVAGGIPVAIRSSFAASNEHGRLLENWRVPHREAARLIRAHRQPGDRLAVWGWDSQVYVETQLPQATRESHSTRQLWDSSQRDTYYRPRYLADLKRNHPAFFVDAVGPDAFFFTDRLKSGHEIFEELGTHISENYVLMGTFDHLRVYFRKDRVPTDG
jgi:hypothetical protein